MKPKELLKKALPFLTFAFIAIVVYFLFGIFTQLDWEEVGAAIRKVDLDMLLAMVGLVAINYTILSTYDLMGFRYLNATRLPYSKIGPSAAVSYAFNFNIGSLLGGLGLRIRIYSGWGVSKKITGFVALFAVMTTWVGYTFLLSLICLLKPAWLDGPVSFSALAIRGIGFFGLALVGGYLLLCNKHFKVCYKEHFFQFPKVRTALAQLLLSSLQWGIASSIIYFFLIQLGGELSWGKVFFTFLIASIGGVIARIPAGLGVIEAVFLKMQPQVPAETILAALLCFRVVYYIVPLLAAIPAYLGIEIIQKKRPGKSIPDRQRDLPAR